MNHIVTLPKLTRFFATCKSKFALKSELSDVATSGSYTDLSNTPTIPTVPTNISAFTNDAGYVTNSSINLMEYAKVASPTFTGTVTAPTLTVTTALNIPGGKIWIE